MLGELQEKPHHGKGFGLTVEELALGGEADRGGLAILLDADFKKLANGQWIWVEEWIKVEE